MADFEVLGNLLEWYAAVFCSLCLAWYAGSLLTPRSRWSFALMAAGYALMRMLASRYFDPGGPETEHTVVRMLILLAGSLALGCAAYRRPGRLLIYVCVSWAAVFELAFFISYSVVFIGDPIYDALGDAFMAAGGDDGDWLMNRVLTVAYGLQILMSAVLTLLVVFSCRSILRAFPRERRMLSGAEFRLLMLPAVVGLLMGILLRLLIITVSDGVPQLLFDQRPVLKAVVPGIAVVTGAAIIYSVRTLRDMVRLEAERRRRLVAEGQLQSLKELVQDSERMNQGVNRMRHDLRNTLAVIQALSEGVPEGEALRSYLDELSGDMKALERPFRTGDPVADVLLASKYRELQDEDPAARFEAENLILSDPGIVSSYDLGIILGNALDNALRALRDRKAGEKFIHLGAFRHGDLLFLTVENSMGDPPAARRDGLPESTKGQDGHGLGLANIRAIAEKYDGTMDWKAQEGVFTLSVMLRSPLSRQEGSQSAPDTPASGPG